MSMLSNLDLIRRVPLFSMLTNDQARAVADGVVKRRYRRGEIVVEQGKIDLEATVNAVERLLLGGVIGVGRRQVRGNELSRQLEAVLA